MNFIPVENLPKKMSGRVALNDYKPMASYLREFMKMNVKYAKVDYTPLEYANAESAYCGFRSAIKRCGLPITVATRGEDIYLIRTDKED